MATARVLHLPLHQPREDTAERAPLRLVRGARNGLGLSPRAGVILTVLAFNLVGDWLRDLLDPTATQAR